MPASECRPTRAVVHLQALVANLRMIRERVGGRDVWAVVKADAYGHGATPVVRALRPERPAGFCVATATEGRQLRRAGVEAPILVLAGSPSKKADGLAVEYGLSVALWERSQGERLVAAARQLGVGPASVHLKLDTGMGRLGVLPGEATELARWVDAEPMLALDGLFSNLATADELGGDPGDERAGGAGGDAPDGDDGDDVDGRGGRAGADGRGDGADDPVARQVRAFVRVCDELDAAGCLPPHRTLANGAAVLHRPETWRPGAFTGVRPGLVLYGASLTAGHDPVELQPAMSLRTGIASIRDLPAGADLGYGRSFTTRRPTRLGVLPIGYHDGWPRALGNRAEALLRGRRVPVVGRISMDLTLLDVTDVSAAAVGDEVVLFGRSGEELPGRRQRLVPVEEAAARAGTIPHEILCRIGRRVPRVYDEGDVAGDGRGHP